MDTKEEIRIMDEIVIPALKDLEYELKDEYSILIDEDNLNLNSFRGDNIADFDFKIKIVHEKKLKYNVIGGDPAVSGEIDISNNKKTINAIKKIVLDYYDLVNEKNQKSRKTMC